MQVKFYFDHHLFDISRLHNISFPDDTCPNVSRMKSFKNCISVVMVSDLALSVVDHGFEPQSNQRLQNWYLLLLCYSPQN